VLFNVLTLLVEQQEGYLTSRKPTRPVRFLFGGLHKKNLDIIERVYVCVCGTQLAVEYYKVPCVA